MKNRITKLKNKISLWVDGEYDLDAVDELPEPGNDGEREVKRREIVLGELKHRRLIHVVYVILAVFCLICMATLLLCTIDGMPRYGESSEHMDMVTYEYLANGMEYTGAVNIVAGIILEYRAFDTLGESFVLFCALTCVLALLWADGTEKTDTVGSDILDLTGDPILRKTVVAIVPLILVFGVYMLLNGHISPGGGFSGGAVIGAAVILLSSAYGENVAGSFLSEKRFKTVSFIALSFYCLSKSYSFYTGANGLHSFIGNGTPGNILSAGLILPLNVAVGMVVACTMYGIYRMIGWRRF